MIHRPVLDNKHGFALLLTVLMGFSCGADLSAQPDRIYRNWSEAASQPDSVYRLDLKGQYLSVIPEEIWSMTNLTHLDLDENGFDSISPKVGNLVNLQRLDLDQNNLSFLPKEIGQLKNLTFLDVDRNKLTSLPEEIGGLTALEIFDLHSNNLTSVPKSIGQLKNLRSLRLEWNNFPAIPSGVYELQQLMVLNLVGNQIDTLDASIFKLPSLGMMDFYGNPVFENQLALSRPFGMANYVWDREGLTQDQKANRAQKVAVKEALHFIKELEVICVEEDWDCGKETYLTEYLQAICSEKELVALSDHPDPKIRIIAIRALDAAEFPGLLDVVLAQLSRKGRVETNRYYEDKSLADVKVADIAVSVKSLNAEQRKHLERVLLYEYPKLRQTDSVLLRMEPDPEHYERVQELAKTKASAGISLERYGQLADSALLAHCLVLDPKLMLPIVAKNPAPYYERALLEVVKGATNHHEMVDVVARFQNQFAVETIRTFLATKYSSGSSYHPTILAWNAMQSHHTALYNPLYFEVWNQYSYVLTDSMFHVLKALDPERTLEMTRTTLKQGSRHNDDDPVRLSMLKYLQERDETASRALVLKWLSTELLMDEERAHYCTEAAALHRSPEITEAVVKKVLSFQRKKHLSHYYSEFDYVPLLPYLLHEDEKHALARIKPLFAHLGRVNEEGTKRVRELFKEAGKERLIEKWLKERQTDFVGSWQVESLESSRPVPTEWDPTVYQIGFSPDGALLMKPHEWWSGHGFWDWLAQDSLHIQFSDLFGDDDLINLDRNPMSQQLTGSWRFKKKGKRIILSNEKEGIEMVLKALPKVDLNLKAIGEMEMDFAYAYEDGSYDGSDDYTLPDSPLFIEPDREDSVGGQPMSFYLNHPNLIPEAKAFLEGNFPLAPDSATAGLLEMIGSEQGELDVIYMHIVHATMDSADHGNGLDSLLKEVCRGFYKQSPCRYFKLTQLEEYHSYHLEWVEHYLYSEFHDYYAYPELADLMRFRVLMQCPDQLEKLDDWEYWHIGGYEGK